MFQHLIVPIDGSAASWTAVPIAARMAATVAGKLDVVTVVDRLADVGTAREELERGVAKHGDLAVAPMAHVLANDSIERALADHVENVSGSMILMSSHGHGRSAAVLGSTVDQVLRLTYGPIIVVGPRVEPSAGSLAGKYIVPVDGSESGDRIVPIAGAWAVEFGAVPWIVEVVEPRTRVADDVFESAHAARLARRLHEDIGREVEYDVLHGDNPATAVVDYADRTGASLVFASTHGRTGLDRLRLGSVAAGMVRHATCPVVLHRPPHLAE